jgi:hypothetical protein
MQEVTIAEAAKRLSMSSDSMRRRISKGQLKARRVPSPHGVKYLVELPEDIPPVTQDNTPEVEALRKTVSILETELEARRREVQELHVLLEQTRALPPGRGVSWWRLNPLGQTLDGLWCVLGGVTAICVVCYLSAF